mmetsp:Transcript_32258/g.78459  ORF Transcript_32258/g.78459 Transcript_32258/m.78459 type:complete len:114 (-) Transcript_32258:352-693(-)
MTRELWVDSMVETVPSSCLSTWMTAREISVDIICMVVSMVVAGVLHGCRGSQKEISGRFGGFDGFDGGHCSFFRLVLNETRGVIGGSGGFDAVVAGVSYSCLWWITERELSVD